MNYMFQIIVSICTRANEISPREESARYLTFNSVTPEINRALISDD